MRLRPAWPSTLDLELTGDDFEFVKKIEFKKQGDPFAQPEPLPFHLPREPVAGPETSLKLRLDAKPLATGSYVFLIAQTDGKVHDTPFKVLPAPPSISTTPMLLNTGIETQAMVLHGTGLDRIDEISADHVQVTLGDSGSGEARDITVKAEPGLEAGSLVTLHLKVKDFEEPVTIEDAFLVAGPRPAITTLRESSQGNLGIALNPGEMAASSLVSFELNLIHAPVVSAVNLFCRNSPDTSPLTAKMGDAKEDFKLTQESPDTLFLSFRPESVGQPGCVVMATLATRRSGQSEPRKLGMIVRLPKIASFEIGSEKASEDGQQARGTANRKRNRVPKLVAKTDRIAGRHHAPRICQV